MPIRTARMITSPVGAGGPPEDIEKLMELRETIERYLPANYTAVAIAGEMVIVGKDVAGWTMEDYVIPRLASGLYWFREVTDQ